GTLPLISVRAVDAIGREAFRGFDLLPAKINDEDFFLPRCREPLDCFDKEQAEYQTFPNSARMMSISKFAFRMDRISDPLLFVIPESSSRLFCTQSVRDSIVRSKLRGFRFEPVTG